MSGYAEPETCKGARMRERQLILRPAWLQRFEARLARRIPLHPHLISAAKVVVVAPLLFASLQQIEVLAGGAFLVALLFACFGALDYLDGMVARERGLESRWGRFLDRATDYPLLVGLSLFCAEVVPLALVMTKLALDLLLLLLFVAGRGSTQNRLRTLLSYAALFSLLALGQGWLPALFTPLLVITILGANIALSLAVTLFNLDLLAPARR
jgi:phosphatidylglycerophosphate synthase